MSYFAGFDKKKNILHDTIILGSGSAYSGGF